MTNALKAILTQVKAERFFFKAASHEERDLSDFQSIVNGLKHLYSEGLLEDFVTHEESHTGHDWVDAVCVGKLTAKGEALLEE